MNTPTVVHPQEVRVLPMYYSNMPVRALVNEHGKMEWNAQDVCDILDYGSRAESVLRKLPEDEKLMRKISASGQYREVLFVTEPGLYRLIFRSNKPEAEAFQRWVFHEVLPSIRENGYYGAPPEVVNQVVVERIEKLEQAMSNLQMSHHTSGTVLYFVHYCCKTGYQREMVAKDDLYQAYVSYCSAVRARPECKSHFCMKLYGVISPAGRATMTIRGKRVAAIRGVSLLHNSQTIINDLNRKWMEKQQQELARRREYYFGIKPEDDKQKELFPIGVLGDREV